MAVIPENKKKLENIEKKSKLRLKVLRYTY